LKVPQVTIYNIIIKNNPGDGIVHKMLDIARKFLAEQLNIPIERITADTTFCELEADSIDVVEVIMALEDIYDVEFPENHLEYYPDLDSLVAFLYEFTQQVRK
jgi:acyl carrier protein